MVQLAGDLEDDTKRVTYEAALVRVERILALQDHVSWPSNRPATMRVQAGSLYADSSEQIDCVLPSTDKQHLDHGTLLPAPENGIGAQVGPVENAALMYHTDVLGEDLLPGLGDM